MEFEINNGEERIYINKVSEYTFSITIENEDNLKITQNHFFMNLKDLGKIQGYLEALPHIKE